VSETCWFCCSQQFNIIKQDGSVEFIIAPVDSFSGMTLLMGCAGVRCARGEIGIYSNSSVQVGKVVKGATSLHKLPWLNKARLWGQEDKRDPERDRAIKHLGKHGRDIASLLVH
jgi:hypothetical protein